MNMLDGVGGAGWGGEREVKGKHLMESSHGGAEGP